MAVDPSIRPIEEFILVGITKRFQQVFDCVCAFTTAADKTAVIARMFEGAPVSYPYATFTIQSIGPNPETYNPHVLGRRGLMVSVNEGFANTVKLIPANFEIEVEYVTDNYQGFMGGSVLSFIRRWLFARRMGYLKFNVNYGKLRIFVSTTFSDAPSAPPRENVTESESVYKVTATFTVHGYVSEPTMSMQGIIDTFDVETYVKGIEADGVSSQFFSF